MKTSRPLPFRRSVIALGLAVLCSGKQPPNPKESPVSYGRQIVPIFALHCYGCHGQSNPSSGLQLSTYKGLRAGGVLGEDIVPGFPARSMLVKFVEGFRGPEQRMPQGSAPLTTDQIHLIRRWIAQGALNDGAATPCYKLRLPGCAISPAHPLQISCNVSVAADLVLLIADGTGHTHRLEEASIKQPPERMDAGAPGQLLPWRLNYEEGWPRQVAVELVIRYTPGPPRALLRVQDGRGSTHVTQNWIVSRCSPE